MNAGKTLFAQLMDFLPWSTFDRIVARYEGNRSVRKMASSLFGVGSGVVPLGGAVSTSHFAAVSWFG